MTQDEYIFLEQNVINFETTKLGFVKNLHPDLLAKYEQIYRNNIDPNYVLTIWCSSCVMSMMNRLIIIYEQYQESLKQSVIQNTETITETPKRKPRTKK